MPSRIFVFCLWSMVYGLWSVAGDISSIQHRDVDPDGYVAQGLTVRRGESALFQFHYTNMAFSISNSVKFCYTSGDLSTNPSHYVITGYVSAATSSLVMVRWTSATAPEAGLYSYETLVEDTISTSVNARAYGELDVHYGVASGSTNTVPQTTLDMLLYTILNAAAGPWILLPAGPSVGQVLTWNGSAWIGSSAGAGDMLTSVYDPLDAGTTVVFVTDSRLSNARQPLAHTQDWSSVTGTPTTLSGYGIADAAGTGHTHTAVNVTDLGTCATSPVSAFASAAQGTLADTALQSEADTNALAQLRATNLLMYIQLTNEAAIRAAHEAATGDAAHAGMYNAANQTNITRSFGGMLDRYPTGAVDNVYEYGPFPSAWTITNLGTYTENGTAIGDFGVNFWTNRARTICYTGLSYTVAASNFARTISVAANDSIWWSITNGSATNAHAHVTGIQP